MKLKTGISVFVLMLLANNLWAESLYVTDRILLGVHEAASKDSTLIQSVPSGTSLEILAEENSFKKVRLPDGTQGWVDAVFLVSEQPAPAQYDILMVKHKRTEQELAALKEKLKKTEKELQVRRDQVSNAKTSMQELKKKFNKQQPLAVIDDEKLKVAEAEIEKLKAKIAELESEEKAVTEDTARQEVDTVAVEKELASLRLRVDMALRNLQGEELLSEEDAGNVPPGLPNWYWGVMLLFLIAGLVTGIGIMDYRNRKRHGGYRI